MEPEEEGPPLHPSPTSNGYDFTTFLLHAKKPQLVICKSSAESPPKIHQLVKKDCKRSWSSSQLVTLSNLGARQALTWQKLFGISARQ